MANTLVPSSTTSKMPQEIQISHLSKKYPGGIVALQPTSVTIPSDQAIGIIGENGSGKSTFIKLLAGYILPDQGTISFSGLSPFHHVTSFRKKLGYLSQDTQLDPEMTGYESLALFSAFYGINGQKQKQRIEKITAAYGLEEHLHHTIKKYSGGLRQRLHLAISVIHNPDYLLMDEPTNALDAAGKKMLWQQIRQRSDYGRTTIIVSHDLSDIEKNCDYLLFFHSGKLVLHGHPRQLIEQDSSYRLIYFIDGQINREALASKVKTLPGIRRMDICKDQVLFSIANQYQGLDRELQQWFHQEGLSILESRTRKTDLSTLYFNITGITGESMPQTGRKNKRRKR